MEFNATFFVTAISFIVFTFIMNKIFYAPLTKVIDEREEFINNAVTEAKDNTNQAENLLKNKEETLNATVEKTRKIITSAAEKANSDGDALTEEAKRQARLKIEDGKSSISKEKEAAQNELKSKVKDLAEIIASKVLQSETRIENVNNELIDRILRRMKNFRNRWMNFRLKTQHVKLWKRQVKKPQDMKPEFYVRLKQKKKQQRPRFQSKQQRLPLNWQKNISSKRLTIIRNFMQSS